MLTHMMLRGAVIRITSSFFSQSEGEVTYSNAKNAKFEGTQTRNDGLDRSKQAQSNSFKQISCRSQRLMRRPRRRVMLQRAEC